MIFQSVLLFWGEIFYCYLFYNLDNFDVFLVLDHFLINYRSLN